MIIFVMIKKKEKKFISIELFVKFSLHLEASLVSYTHSIQSFFILKCHDIFEASEFTVGHTLRTEYHNLIS